MNEPEYQRMYEAEESHWWYSGMRRISLALLDGVLPTSAGAPFRILDAGCGTGNNLRHLAEHGGATGIDLSDDAVRFCRDRGVSVVRASVAALPFRDAAFDCATSFDVLYHRWVEDDAAAVKEMARVVRPGGHLLIRLPALEILRRAHDEAVLTRHRYTRREVRRLVAGAGLTLVRDTYCNSLLLPVVALRSAFDSFFGSTASELAPLPAPLEWLFRTCLRLEARLVRHVSLPIGASVVVLARKPLARLRSLP